MPMYDYICESCGESFEEMKSMANSDQPCKEPCPMCGKKKVKKAIAAFPSTATDSTLTADKVTGGKWSELTTRMKENLPKRLHHKLDGGQFKGDQVKGRRWN